MKVADVRREYALAGLSEETLAADPVDQLRLWLDQAREAQPEDFTAMVLATADREGRPAARVVLLKGLDERGLVFYTHYESRKGEELLENPRAALVFYWSALERQVRIEGTVEKVSREESAAYFVPRPRGSRLGAWASPQSRPLASRKELEERVAAAAERFADSDVAAKRPQVEGEVKVASGPWGLEEDWWAEDPTGRDYWDVELAGRGLYRIYRERTTGVWYADGIYD